jgi:alkylation response protein AidB-like acyl-CoA dehydrogenase
MAVTHPQNIISQEWLQKIRSYSAAAEAARQLHPEQLALVYEQRWFTLLTPAQYGGLEWTLPDVVQLEEAVAWADGSLAWVLTLCTGAGWFGGFLQPGLASRLFALPHVCLAGSGAATGEAAITSGGYLVNGSWLHASGAPHATAFTANCVLTRNGQPLHDDQGKPVIRPFVFLKEEVRVQPTWQSFGLVATASHAFTVNNLAVPEERCFLIEAASAYSNGPLYQYPFLQLAELTLAANISGMCLHFLDEAALLLQRKEKATAAMPVLEKARHTIETRRAVFYEALQLSWQQLVQNKHIAYTTLQAVSTAARALAKEARSSVDELYPYCGLAAAATGSMINQVWRDIHTASQHSLLVYAAD